METTKANISFADDWRRDLKDQALEACWESIEKVDIGKVLEGALGKAPGIDGQQDVDRHIYGSGHGRNNQRQSTAGISSKLPTR